MRFQISPEFGDPLEEGKAVICEEGVLAYANRLAWGAVYQMPSQRGGDSGGLSRSRISPRGFYGGFVYTSAGRAEGSDE